MFLLLLPLFCIVNVLYVLILVNFSVGGALDIFLLSLVLPLNIGLFYAILKALVNSNFNVTFLKNIDNHLSSIHGYFCFILLALFAISMIVNTFFSQINIANLCIGILIIVLFIYITVEYVFKTDKTDLLLIDISNVNESINALKFRDKCDNIYVIYESSKKNFQKGCTYLCCLNKKSKYIKKIKELVKK